MSKPPVIFVANIGTSDIEELKSSNLERGKTFFEESKRLWQEKRWDDITLTIIDKKIEYLKRRYDLRNSKIVLCATDQLDPTVKTKDTIFAASLIKEKIITSEPFIKEENVRILIQHGNPTDINFLQKWYDTSFFELFKVSFEKGYRLVIGITGGAPAQNYTLLFLSSIKYSNFLEEVLYKPEWLKEVSVFENTFYQEFVRKHISVLEENKLYYSALQFGEKTGVLTDKEKQRLEFLNLYSNFSFFDAIDLLNKHKDNEDIRAYIRAHPYIKDNLKVYESFLRQRSLILENKGALNKTGKNYFINYLHVLTLILQSARERWDRGDYPEFLVRIVCFKDLLVKFFMEYKEGLPFSFNWDEGSIKEKIDKWFEEKGKNIPGNRRKDKLINFAKSIPEARELLGYLDAKISNEIVQLRNNIILTHGFEGVSKDYLLESLGERGNIEPFFEKVNDKLSKLKKKLSGS